MAGLGLPDITTSTKLSNGTTYSYVHVPAKDGKPYLLLLHGFPSSAYDWRHQVNHFSDRGYGLIIPDLLGYGGTDKPTEKDSYRLKKMSDEFAEILDTLKVEKVVGVGHDWYDEARNLNFFFQQPNLLMLEFADNPGAVDSFLVSPTITPLVYRNWFI